MTRGVALADVHSTVQARHNEQDLEGLVALYEPGATLVLLDGGTVSGTEAIREQWASVLELKGQMTLRSRFLVETGELALLSNEWTLSVGDQSMSAIATEVLRRQPDGGWLYVVDHPWSSLEPGQAAALAAALGI
jgi:ketosteroid isomerase-like protein